MKNPGLEQLLLRDKKQRRLEFATFNDTPDLLISEGKVSAI